MHESYDVCVVGGGAAGMSAAIAAAQNGYSVCIIDKNKKLGKKLYATGNGRCNLANADTGLYHFHSSSAQSEKDNFLDRCLGKDMNDTLFPFLRSVGIYVRNIDGYYYPGSMQASALVWAFLDCIHSLSIDVKEAETVKKVERIKSGYKIYASKEIIAKNVILACGGRSYTSLGGCTYGYDISKALRIPVHEQRPALCGLYTKEDTESIKGVRVSCSAWIETDQSKKQYGELQITEYGLSGIMMFNLSSEIGEKLKNQSEITVVIDFLESVKKENFMDVTGLQRTLYGYVNTFLPDKLALYLIASCGMQPKKMVQELSNEEFERLYDTCRHYRFHIVDLKDYETAQVTAGGISLRAVDPDTMEIWAYPGMYAAGEMLDIDGDCGGYNLTFAVLTGLRAGRACHDKN